MYSESIDSVLGLFGLLSASRRNHPLKYMARHADFSHLAPGQSSRRPGPWISLVSGSSLAGNLPLIVYNMLFDHFRSHFLHHRMASAAAQMTQWSGEKPADGGFYVLRNDRWYCQLCWKVADESHVFSNPHRAKMNWHFRPGQPFPPSAPTWEPPHDPVWGVAAAAAAAAQPPVLQPQPPLLQLPVAASSGSS